MRLLRYLARIIQRIRNFFNKRSHYATIELIHPSFGLADNQDRTHRDAPNALAALMYSKENEAFFV